jgi:putative transposase
VDLLREPAKEHSEEKGHAMALDQSALLELLEALKVADVDDRIRSATEALIEAELTAVIGAAPHERARIAQRNGHRTRTLTTTAGDLEHRPCSADGGRFTPRSSTKHSPSPQ